MVSLAIVLPAWVQVRVDSAQFQLNCTILQAEVDQLQAIRRNGVLIEEIAESLGLPIVPPPPIEIPEVPATCDTS